MSGEDKSGWMHDDDKLAQKNTGSRKRNDYKKCLQQCYYTSTRCSHHYNTFGFLYTILIRIIMQTCTSQTYMLTQLFQLLKLITVFQEIFVLQKFSDSSISTKIKNAEIILYDYLMTKLGSYVYSFLVLNRQGLMIILIVHAP